MCGRVMTENSCELDLLANRVNLNDHNTLSGVVITIRLDENMKTRLPTSIRSGTLIELNMPTKVPSEGWLIKRQKVRIRNVIS